MSPYITIVSTARVVDTTPRRKNEAEVQVEKNAVPLWDELTDKSVVRLQFADYGPGVKGESLNHFIANLANPDTSDNDVKQFFWACFPNFTTSTTVFNTLVEHFRS